MIEQAVLGVAGLLLAWRLGPSAFAPIGALLVVNSVAIALADLGIGMAIMSGGVGSVGQATYRCMRCVTHSLAIIAICVGLWLGETSGHVVLVAGLLWSTAAEAYVRKAIAIAQDLTAEVARLEIAGSLTLTVFVLGAFVSQSGALMVMGAGLVLKQTIECAVCARPSSELPAGGTGVGEPLRILVSQGLSTATANLDYLVVALAFGAAAFSVYSVAFRFTSLIPSQVSAAAQRVVLVELSPKESARRRMGRYRRRLIQLFLIGLVATAAAILVAPAVPAILGSGWSQATPVIIVLAIAVPWRNLGSLGSAALLGSMRSVHLVRFEIGRLLLTGVSYAVAASLGVSALVGTVAIAAVLSGASIHFWACQRSQYVFPSWFAWATGGGVALAAVVAVALSPAIATL